MPEYVYALHDFVPEHEDEISFSAGDRIEVIEKDDMYGDGWWQGRNLFGKVGLFPQSYTTSDPSVVQNPAAPQVNGHDAAASAASATTASLQTLNEEPEDASAATPEANKKDEGQGVMRATLTDVQEAIEQLGRNDRDGNGSFSFASTHTDTDHDTDTDANSNAGGLGGESWHKGARSNLAEKARQQQELLKREQEVYEAELQLHAPVLTEQTSEPPIAFEMSDESEDEGDEELEHGPAAGMLFPRREHEHISEEEEDDAVSARQQLNEHPVTPRAVSHSPKHSPSPKQNPSSISTPEDGDDLEGHPPETARQVSFPTENRSASGSPSRGLATKEPHLENGAKINQPTTRGSPRPASRIISQPKGMPPQGPLPSPPSSQKGSAASQAPKYQTSPPSEWTVDDVVEWAKSKGFDDSVTDKFVEHEISGDVLLEIDANVLKTELEIHAFGKRTRIAKEIVALRPPPPEPLQPPPSESLIHSRSASQSVSLPGSTHHSTRSPLGFGAMLSPESPPHTGDLAGTPAFGTMRRDSDPGSSLRVSETDQEPESSTVNNSTVSSSTMGLGISMPTGSGERLELPKGKNRPAHLNLYPSDPALNSKSKMAKFSPKSIAEESLREERSAMSDTESPLALESRSKRRRIFGRSTGSANSEQKENGSRNSKEHQRDMGPATPNSLSTSIPGSPSTKRGSTEDGSVKYPQRRKRSVDTSKPSDRLSLFGGSLSLTRSRKPAPRVQSYAHDDLLTEKQSRSLSRLYLGGGNRKASGKSQLTTGSGKDDDVDPRVLRKRTTSSLADIPSVPGLPGTLKAGQSVLEQIGTPDHNGWMRKKGEHYNTWKLRYFVLKGPHLYYLRSNSKAETKIKGYINIIGYKVIVDENINPGKYGFRLIHETERTHYFSSDESITVREWMKALMKATIGRDYTKPVISSCNIPTIPLSVAQTMNPAPRPPSPTQRAATQKALRRENPNQLSSRDARILMGLPQAQNGTVNGNENGGPVDMPPRIGDDLFNTLESLPENPQEQVPTPRSGAATISTPPPVRPNRETRRTSVPAVDGPSAPVDLIRWANSYLPPNLQVQENSGQIYSGLALYRLAEGIKGKPSDPPVPDSAFPSGPNDDRLDGLFKLFDLFLDNDIRMGNVSINDVRQGRTDKIVQLLRSLRAWEEKRKAVARSIGRSAVSAGPFMAMEPAGTSISGALHAW